jgi:SAM-dependent methyltransferase
MSKTEMDDSSAERLPSPFPSLPSRAEMLEYLLSFDMFSRQGRQAEGVEYATFHLERFAKTLEHLPRLPGQVRVLELGASPYFMTFLIKRFFGYEITPANFFLDYGEEVSAEIESEMTVSSARYGERHTFQFTQFNLEFDPFPHGDAEFDLVLCCEILEHLAMDPSHMLREIHRVLKPGGQLVLTTPNVGSIENIRNLMRGYNIYHAYSGFGIYGRHSREYTRNELHQVLSAHRFEPHVFVDDVYSHRMVHRLLTRWPWRSRRDNLFAIARKVSTSIESHPDWLYHYQGGKRRVHKNEIVMGVRDRSQLGEGWHEVEHDGRTFRWTHRHAVAYLRPKGHETRFGMTAATGAKRASGRVLLNGVEAARFSVEPGQRGELLLEIPTQVGQDYHSGKYGQCEVRIEVDEVLVPSRDVSGSSDAREYGIKVERLWLV